VRLDSVDALQDTHNNRALLQKYSYKNRDFLREEPCGIFTVTVCCAVVCCSVLQCVAVCCGVLQCVAVCCSALQGAAVSCSVLRCVCFFKNCRVACLGLDSADAPQNTSTLADQSPRKRKGVCCTVVCCSVMQCVADAPEDTSTLAAQSPGSAVTVALCCASCPHPLVSALHVTAVHAPLHLPQVHWLE